MLINIALASVLGTAVAVLHFRAPQLGEPRASSIAIINRTARDMMGAPLNLTLQRQGCQTLLDTANQNREGLAPFGGRRIATALLDAGFAEVGAQGLLNSLANENASNVDRKDAASKCFEAITCVKVQNDHIKSLALFDNSPHVWEAMVEYLRTYRQDRNVLRKIEELSSLYGSCTPQSVPGLAKAGGFDLIFETLRDNHTDAALLHSALVALSDHVQCSKEAAWIVADTWGHLTGAEVLVTALKLARESGKHFHDKHGIGTLYVAVHNVNGLLAHDENQTLLNAILNADFENELRKVIKTEDDRMLQDSICQSYKWLTDNNTHLQAQLVSTNIFRFLSTILMQFAHPPHKDSYTVTHSCSTALLNFARTNQTVQDLLINYGIDNTLDKKVLDTYRGWDDGVSWRQYFPTDNIFELQEILQKRKDEVNKTK